MAAILSRNWKASILAHSLWEFYNYQLYCTVRGDDGEPNTHRIDGITSPENIDTIRVCISIRDNGRQEPGLVHELLHANLIPLGYPRFWIKACELERSRLAKGITNLADHIVMLPIYCSFGYSADVFLAPCKPLNEQERRVDAKLKETGEELRTPQGYFDRISHGQRGARAVVHRIDTDCRRCAGNRCDSVNPFGPVPALVTACLRTRLEQKSHTRRLKFIGPQSNAARVVGRYVGEATCAPP